MLGRFTIVVGQHSVEKWDNLAHLIKNHKVGERQVKEWRISTIYDGLLKSLEKHQVESKTMIPSDIAENIDTSTEVGIIIDEDALEMAKCTPDVYSYIYNQELYKNSTLIVISSNIDKCLYSHRDNITHICIYPCTGSTIRLINEHFDIKGDLNSNTISALTNKDVTFPVFISCENPRDIIIGRR